MNDSPKYRTFVVGTATMVMALASCTPEAPKNNLYDILSKYELKGQDGNPVNIAALQTTQKNKFSTLTFRFHGCTAFCPITDAMLGKVAKEQNALAHVVVSVQPQYDGVNQDARDAFMQTFRKMGVKGDVVILYPKSEADAIKIQNDAALIVNQKIARQHSSQIVLFRPNGTPVGKKDGLKTDNFGDWQAIMQQEKTR